MKVLIDIGHPAHVHLFKHFAKSLISKGHEVLFTARDKEVTIQLLKHYNFRYISLGKHFKNPYKKTWGLFLFTFKLLIVNYRFKPTLLISHGSMYAAISAFIYNKPHISFENNGNWEQIKLYLPFTKTVFTPWNLTENLGRKQIRLLSFHEIAYLHPNYFIPNNSIYDLLNISSFEKYCIIRFVSWNATHDNGQGGLNETEKEAIINILSKHYKIFISSEGQISEKYKKFLIKIPPERMHDALYFSDLVISEGATMASEAGVLGTPSIYVNSLSRCYNQDQEAFGTVFNFSNGTGVLEKTLELLKDDSLNMKKKIQRQNLIESRIDLTKFLIWFIENYPGSDKIMKENPDYQYNFK